MQRRIFSAISKGMYLAEKLLFKEGKMAAAEKKLVSIFLLDFLSRVKSERATKQIIFIDLDNRTHT